MRGLLLLVTLSALLAVSLAACTYKGSSKSYSLDLGSFEAVENDNTGALKYKYTYDLCNQFAGSGCGGNCAKGNGFQFPPPPASSCSNVGLNPVVTEIAGGIQVTLVNGIAPCGQCKNGAVNRTSILNIMCDGSKNTLNNVVITEPNTCQYAATFYHPNACGGGGSGPGPNGKPKTGLSPGSIFLIVFFVTATVYLVAGFIVNWKVRGASPGVEALPQFELWREVPGLVVDGFKFTKAKIMGLFGQGSYTQL